LFFSVLGAIAGYIVAPAVAAISGGELLQFRRGRLVSMRAVALYAMPLLLLAVLSMAYMNLDLFVVKSLVPGAASAGYYTAAQSVARVPYYLASGFATMLLPALARVETSDPRRARLMVQDAIRFGILLLVPISVVLAASAQGLIQLLYGERYISATEPLMLLSAAMGIFAFFTFLGSMLAGLNRTSHAVLAISVGLVATGAMALALVPTLGSIGAAISTLIGASLALLVALAATLLVVPFQIPWRSIVRVGAASAAIGLIATDLHGPTATLLGLPALGALYLGILILLHELGATEWHRLRSIIPRRSEPA
jgi:O-antigen/teichoic acid export membrane protein